MGSMRRNFILLLAGILLLLPIGIFHTVIHLWKLPVMKNPEVSIVYDASGEMIQTLSERNDQSVSKNGIADIFIQAVIAIEDRRFYQHHGVDPLGILRAAGKNIRHGRIVEGGSTITQQTAKMLFLSNEQTFQRKLLDMVYALQMERKYSKDEIITMYCNAAYFGHGAYGIETASHTYFAKKAKELTLPEAALLAGLLQSPSYYDPYIHPEQAQERQKEVLNTMYQSEVITAEEKKQAEETILQYQMSSSLSGDAPWMIDEIREHLIEKYGRERIYQGGLQIYTSLDLQMQRAANQAVQDVMQEHDPELQAALIAVEPGTGYIRAMVGGSNYKSSAYNRVYAKRQPGSTYKPFIYSLAMEQGYTQASQIECKKRSYILEDGSVYTPADYGRQPYHNRMMTLREAVMRSDNAAAVYLHSLLEPEKSASYIKAFGFEKTRPVLSSVLGSVEASPIEMACAYSVFASGGYYAEPQMILRILDKEGNILEENSPKSYPVIDENIAYVITDMLKGVMISPGTGAHLQAEAGREAAAKTGTTDDFHDAWMMGYTPEICCSVWVGYDRESNVNLTGSAVAGPIWAQFLRKGLEGRPVQSFTCPESIIFTNICMETGCAATESCPWTMQAAFIRGTEPDSLCWEHAGAWDWVQQWQTMQEEEGKEQMELNKNPEQDSLPSTLPEVSPEIMDSLSGDEPSVLDGTSPEIQALPEEEALIVPDKTEAETTEVVEGIKILKNYDASEIVDNQDMESLDSDYSESSASQSLPTSTQPNAPE